MYHLGEYDQEITSEIKIIMSVQILYLNEKLKSYSVHIILEGSMRHTFVMYWGWIPFFCRILNACTGLECLLSVYAILEVPLCNKLHYNEPHRSLFTIC